MDRFPAVHRPSPLDGFECFGRGYPVIGMPSNTGPSDGTDKPQYGRERREPGNDPVQHKPRAEKSESAERDKRQFTTAGQIRNWRTEGARRFGKLA